MRPDLDTLPAYRAGARPAPGRGPTYSLASNESPFPPSPSVLRAITEAAAGGHRYPDPTNGALVATLTQLLGVPDKCIGLGTGSVAMCQQAVVAAAAAGEEVVYAWRSFEAYPIITQTAAARSVPVPLTPDSRHDLPAMAAAVTPNTRVVFLCSPNNPTGPVLSDQEVREFLAQVPDDLLVVIDEAYHEYVTDPAAVDGVALAQQVPNVVALRTLSKAYGLAGFRVGYGVAHPDLMARLRPVALPFGVSRVAEAAAIAALAEPDEMARRVAATVAERVRVVAALSEAGWRIPAAEGNFVWLPLGESAAMFAEACLERGFTVRAFPGEGARVTIAEPDANDLFLEVASRWPFA